VIGFAIPVRLAGERSPGPWVLAGLAVGMRGWGLRNRICLLALTCRTPGAVVVAQ